MKEMQELEKILVEELAKHFSTMVDLRVYENLPVILENGEEELMNRLGRVTLKSPQMVVINFSDNPAVIKAAKLALQKSALNVNPQQEGIALYIQVPKMSRERREQLAHSAKHVLFNDFKKALNDVYSKYDKKSSLMSKTHDEATHTRNVLLSLKHSMEMKGAERLEESRVALLKEVN
ncbi:hypothetical protein AB6A40_007389 [Gnathostoma spinigerum]|uniref:Ribosome-recycling factor, mitochondrial n=1 Tax=Gnathostoma spinigerum TaxID=75299 RepID=A0ABD6EMB0_9BILA